MSHKLTIDGQEIHIMVSAAVRPDELVIKEVGIRPMTSETVYSGYSYECDELLTDHIKFLSDLLNDIPDEYKAVTKIEIENEYDSSYAKLRIYYSRPYTDEEIKAQEERAARYEAERVAREKREYERLKAKFDAPP